LVAGFLVFSRRKGGQMLSLPVLLGLLAVISPGTFCAAAACATVAIFAVLWGDKDN